MTHRQKFPNDQGTPVSKFVMFRCMVTMAHADGTLCQKEKTYLRGFLDMHRLTRIQRNVIEDDFVNPAQMHLLLPMITDPVYRGQLVYFARVLAFKDGKICPSEQDTLDKLSETIHGGDLDGLRQMAREQAGLEMRRHDRENGDMSPEDKEALNTWFGYFFDALYLLRMFF